MNKSSGQLENNLKKQFYRQHPVISVVAGTLVILLLLKLTAPDKSSDMKILPQTRVQLIKVIQKDITVKETLVGRLKPVRSSQLNFEVSSQVQQRLVEPGESVQKGQVLLVLDDSDYKNQVDNARAQLQIEQAAILRDRRLLKLAKENRKLQEKEVRRQQRLLKKSLTSAFNLDSATQRLSQLQLDEARLIYSVTSSDARLIVKQSALERAERNLAHCQLKSPWAGKVNRVLVQVGDYVTPLKSVLGLVDDQRLEFLLSLRGEVARRLSRLMPVSVMIDGRKVTGSIIAMQTDPDPETFTHEIRISLPAGAGYAGQMVKADIQLPTLPQVLVVPATAIIYEDGKRYVMRYRNGMLQRTPVLTGVRVGNDQVILNGLQAGEKIVLRDVASLSDGQQVKVGTEKRSD